MRWSFPHSKKSENMLGKDNSTNRYVQNNYSYNFNLQVISAI